METNEPITLDEMAQAWQHQSQQIEQALTSSQLSEGDLHVGAKRHDAYRRQSLSNIIILLLCIAALAWLCASSQRYVVDLLDLIPHLMVAGIVIWQMALCIGQMRRSRHHRHAAATIPETIQFADDQRSHKHTPPLPLAVATAAIVLIVLTPVYDGRAMSVSNSGERIAVMNKANHLIACLTYEPTK